MKKVLFTLIAAIFVLASTSAFAQNVAQHRYTQVGMNQTLPATTFSIVGTSVYKCQAVAVGQSYGWMHVSDGLRSYEATADWSYRVACTEAPFCQDQSSQGILNSSGSIYPQGGVATCTVFDTRNGYAPICDATNLALKIGVDFEKPWDPNDPAQSVEMPKKIAALLAQQ